LLLWLLTLGSIPSTWRLLVRFISIALKMINSNDNQS
jgi:hypothetical protein